MKRVFFSLLVVVTVVLCVYMYGVILNARAASVTNLRKEGRSVIDGLKSVRGSSPSFDDVHISNFNNSTDYFNDFAKKGGSKIFMAMFEYSTRITKDTNRHEFLTSENNIWTIARNVPTNAPDNFIVLMTRNVNPQSLRLKLTEDEMDHKISFLKPEKIGILNHVAILFRKDGSSYAVNCSKRFSKYCTYRFVYNSRPYNLVTNNSGVPIQYLLPNRQVTLDNSNIGEKPLPNQDTGHAKPKNK